MTNIDIFSGSATEMDDGKQLLMYTSVIAEKQPLSLIHI